MRIRSFYIKRRSEYRHARRVGGVGHGFRGNMSDYHGAVLAAEQRRVGASRSDEEWKGKRAIEVEEKWASLSVTANSALWGGSVRLTFPPSPQYPDTVSLTLVRSQRGDRRRGISWRINRGSSFHCRAWGLREIWASRDGGGDGCLPNCWFAVILIHWFTNVELEESFF